MIDTMVMTGKLSRRLWEERRVLYCTDLVESLWNLYEKRTTKPLTEADLEAQYNVSAMETPVSGADSPQSVTETPVKVAVMPHSIGKERKGKESIVEKNARAMEKHITAEPDEVLTVYRKGIEALGLPTTAWPEPGNQHTALKDITARTKLLAPDSALPDPVEFARGILAVFKRRKETGKGGYWKDASPAPKVLLRRFDELVVGLGDEFARAETEREGMDALRRMGKI